jgi:tryptophanyl-tRNA synthetase
LNNAIYLKDTPEELWNKVKIMYTDPHHLRVEDPGKTEGNAVFTYLEVLGTDKEKISELKAHYQRGGLGDMTVKKYLYEVLESQFATISQKRALYAADKAQVLNILKEGTEIAQAVADKTLQEVKEAMKLQYV